MAVYHDVELVELEICLLPLICAEGRRHISKYLRYVYKQLYLAESLDSVRRRQGLTRTGHACPKASGLRLKHCNPWLGSNLPARRPGPTPASALTLSHTRPAAHCGFG